MSEETREKIVRVASSLFAQEGYHYVSLAKVARSAGIRTNTIFNYFLNKEELLEEVLEKGWKALEKKFQDNLKDVLDPKEKLLKAIATLLEFGREEHEMLNLMTVEYYQPYTLIEKLPNILSSSVMRKISNLIESIIEEGKKKGEFKEFQNVPLARTFIMAGTIACIYAMERRKWLNKKKQFEYQDVLGFVKSMLD